MIVGIDAHAIGSGVGGNETYVAGLLSGLCSLETGHTFVVYFASEAAAGPWRERCDHVRPVVLGSPSRLSRLLRDLPARAEADGLDLVHVSYVAPPFLATPHIVTVHDISYELYPHWYPRALALGLRVGCRRTIGRAEQVICVSKAARLDFLNRYSVPPDHVSVTHNAVDHERFGPHLRTAAAPDPRLEGPVPYVLSVGNLQPRKNLLRLIDAFALASTSRPDLDARLVLVGRESFGAGEVRARIDAHDLASRVILLGYVSPDLLPILYARACVFAYCSLYEGFGLPVLEAMASGTPVVASAIPAVVEVVAGAGVLVDPTDTASIADGLTQTLEDPSLRGDLARRGLERAREFSWTSTALGTIAAYERAYSRRQQTGPRPARAALKRSAARSVALATDARRRRRSTENGG